MSRKAELLQASVAPATVDVVVVALVGGELSSVVVAAAVTLVESFSVVTGSVTVVDSVVSAVEPVVVLELDDGADEHALGTTISNTALARNAADFNSSITVSEASRR